MDETRFDALAKTINHASRRGLLVSLASVAGLGMLIAPFGEDAAARKRRKRRRKRGGSQDNGAGDGSGNGGGGGGGGCTPDCNGQTCGDDGCGGTCSCEGDAECIGGVCIGCNPACPAGQRCLHGTCTCDPFANQCPNDVDGQCTCGAVVGTPFVAACVDRNSACNLESPCDNNSDCPIGSVCLLGCKDLPDAHNGRRCSRPCIAV